MRKFAKIIVSPSAIPDLNMGSWGKMIEYWLQDYNGNTIDYLLCPLSAAPLKSNHTQVLDCTYSSREINHPLYEQWRYRKYFSALKKIFTQYQYAVFIIIENTKLKNAVSGWLEKNKLIKNARIIFYQVGFTYEFNRAEYRDFKKGLHEIILLTKNAYDYDRKKYHEYPFVAHILPNPVNKSVFFPLTASQKSNLRSKFDWQSNENIFLWVSHDRPKKGLDLILGIWPDVVRKYPLARLIVVGATRPIDMPGLQFIGKIPNHEIAAYYQAGDIFLFTTLCMEGYGLSLTEAISCGCYCIASANGGVPEVLKGSNHILNPDPNLESSWMEAIDQYMVNKTLPLNTQTYLSYQEWCSAIEAIITRCVSRLLQSLTL